MRDAIVRHGIAFGLVGAVLFVAAGTALIPKLRRDAVAVARFVARAWVGNVDYSRNRRRQRAMTRTVAQRATSEYLSLSHDEWVAAAEEQYRMEADR